MAAPSAARGSAHHQPQSLFNTIPASAIVESHQQAVV
jgi:hypothetical protein